MTLADQSRVTLDADSAIAVNFSAGEQGNVNQGAVQTAVSYKF